MEFNSNIMSDLKENADNVKHCALCECQLPYTYNVSLCDECMKCADCCVGLEKIND